MGGGEKGRGGGGGGGGWGRAGARFSAETSGRYAIAIPPFPFVNVHATSSSALADAGRIPGPHGQSASRA